MTCQKEPCHLGLNSLNSSVTKDRRMGWPRLGEYACLTDGWWGSSDTKQGFWDSSLVLDEELFPGPTSFDVFRKNWLLPYMFCGVLLAHHSEEDGDFL